jgi:hypothetical protein
VNIGIFLKIEDCEGGSSYCNICCGNLDFNRENGKIINDMGKESDEKNMWTNKREWMLENKNEP